MAEKNKLASIPGQPLPERQSNFLSDLWDEASGAFARYGRRSAAQRDASLALLNQAVDPNTDPLSGAAQKVLGLAGLVTHPLAFFPTREEWDQRLESAGNDSRIGRSIGGFLSDLPSLIDPQMAAGGTLLAMAPIVGKMSKSGKTLSHAELLARGADGHLSSAREMQIPVSKVVGREPTPAAAEGMPYVKGRPITQPIEVEYNAADDTYTLYAGNHRITQAELNGDEFIPAFVQGDRGKFGESRLGRSLGDLMQDAANNKELDALGARLQAEAAQTGGAANTTSRDEALQNLVGDPGRKQLVTQSYKETLPDGTTRWVPGTLRANPTTGPRFEPDMSIADIRRYIEQFGEPPPPRAKGEIVTGKRKDVYPDGTVTPVPGLLRTKRPASLGEALQATAPLAAKMLNKADDVADAGITAYHASPYKFDKFSMQHMGTGHGKQQEGAGLYFTDDSLLADEYWKNHAGKSPEAIAEKFATNWGPEAASKLEQFAARRSQEMRPEAVKPLYDALEMLRSGADTSSKGARYMVRISAAGDEILDLTKGGKVPVEIGDPLKLTPETAKKNGIKVLAYKAGVESSNPSAKNYVVFDESIITILKKYGIPMTAGAGGAMMVAGQDMPPEFASQMGGA